MRVIAGKRKRLPLKAPQGLTTRPTTDRIKETLFNIIQDELCDCNFLDLFCGSGAIGIEAASRGAACCCLVEKDKKALQCVHENLVFTRLTQECRILAMDALSACKKLEGTIVFDFIFMDPPYDTDSEKIILQYLSTSKLVHKHTLIIVEASLKTEFDYLDKFGFQMIRRKEYKTNAHVFLMRMDGGEK